MTTPQIRKLSDFMDDMKRLLCIETDDEQITLRKIVDDFSEQGYSILLFLFALPAALPFPAIGLNVIIALPLLLLTAQQTMARNQIWMPRRVQEKKIRTATLQGFLDKAKPWVQKIEIFSRPRLSFMTHEKLRPLIGFAGLIMAISVCIPLPFTNTIPSLGIALMAFGVLMRDGLIVIGGMLLGVLWISLLSYMVVFFGTEGIEMLKSAIKSVL